MKNKYHYWRAERIWTKFNGYMQWVWVADYIRPNYEKPDMMLDHCCAFTRKDLRECIKRINKVRGQGKLKQV